MISRYLLLIYRFPFFLDGKSAFYYVFACSGKVNSELDSREVILQQLADYEARRESNPKPALVLKFSFFLLSSSVM